MPPHQAGREQAGALAGKRYQATVKPMHERYVEPSKRYADLVVPEGGKNLVALTMITGHIRHYLDEGHDEI